MASCQTSKWVSTSPYVRLTVTESASTGDTATLSWELEYIASSAADTSVLKTYSVVLNGETVKNGNYNIDGKTGTNVIASGTKVIAKATAAKNISFSCSFAFNLTWSGSFKGTANASGSISVAAKTSYTVTYNANGGTGAPAAQKKWHGTALTLSSTKPTLTGYTFQGWAKTASGSVAYAAGASYTNNASITLYAVWKANTYTVTYNANGGTGAPASQTKTYGVVLPLSKTIPTRANYTFKGWSASPTATTATYAAGAGYKANAAVTLYAVWELAYIKPRITNLSVSRCNSAGAESDEGTYALVSFAWASDKAVSSITIEWEFEKSGSGSKTVSASGTSGNVSEIVGSGALTTDATYTFFIRVTDASGYNEQITTLSGTAFALDFLAGGKGAAFGKPAELEGVLDIAYQTRFFGGQLPMILEAETDLNEVFTPNTYTGENISHYNYLNCPVTSGTFTLLVESCGESGQIRQTFSTCSKYKPEKFVRFYYQGEWGEWCWASTDEYVLYENSAGSNGTITLSAACSHYRYLEIYFTDNNGKSGGYTKVWNPSGKTVILQIQEPGASVIYSRQTPYTISGTSMTPDTANAGFIKFSGTSFTINSNFNYIKITRVIGRA